MIYLLNRISLAGPDESDLLYDQDDELKSEQRESEEQRGLRNPEGDVQRRRRMFLILNRALYHTPSLNGYLRAEEGSEKAREDFKLALSFGRKLDGKKIDVDVLALLKGVGSSAEHTPHEDINRDLLCPYGRRVEEISPHDLVEEDQSHHQRPYSAKPPHRGAETVDGLFI